MLRTGFSHLLKRGGALAEKQALPALQHARAFAAEPAAAASDEAEGKVTQASVASMVRPQIPLTLAAERAPSGAKLQCGAPAVF